jgi:SAM-dependent methyltransferase
MGKAVTRYFEGAGWRLFVASLLSLFTELLLIRWIPSAIHVVAFFANLVLIGAFLGIGVGMTRPAPVVPAVWRASFRLAVVTGVAGIWEIVLPFVALPAGSDYALNEVQLGASLSIPMPLILATVFGMVAWVMIPFGQLVAVYFDRMPALSAYSINILGSLLGVGAFAFIGHLQLSPAFWFCIVFALLLLLSGRLSCLVPLIAVLSILGVIHLGQTRYLKDFLGWSPYYKVVARPVVTDNLDNGFIIVVNNQFLLSGLDLRAGDADELKSYYDFPFQFRHAKRVLVLGAGAGNDVAAALRAGAEKVTAVEIDPLVLELGMLHHPERPYSSPRVTIVTDDARSFLSRSSEQFDLILFATLDAHGLLSTMGSVRLDSFVYTLDSLREARRHLAPDGLLALSFGPFREDIQYRQYLMVRTAFGRDPLFYAHIHDHRTIVAGAPDDPAVTLPPAWRRIGPAEIEQKLAEYPQAAIPATDDWPHLLLRQPKLPTEYVSVLAGMLLVAAAFIAYAFRGARRLDGQFFFLGAGFLLLETKSVTSFALLWGATWQTNAIVFAVVLTTILLANLWVLRHLPLPPTLLLYALIGCGLLAEFLWPVTHWVQISSFAGQSLGLLYLGLPIFVAGLIFSTALRSAQSGSSALASNLMGAVLGGASEYLSLTWGLRSLSLIAILMYFAAAACCARKAVAVNSLSGAPTTAI